MFRSLKVVKMHCEIDWVHSAKSHITSSSTPWRHYRAQAVAELKSRIEKQLKPHGGQEENGTSYLNKPLRDWTNTDKTDLAKAVELSVKSIAPQVFKAALEDVRHIVNGHFHKHVHTTTLSSKHSDVTLVESKIDTALKQAESSVCFLLARWPGSRDVMRLAMNVSFPEDLRMTAWRACLMDVDVRAGIFKLIHEIDLLSWVSSDTFKTMRATLGSTLYDVCHKYLSSRPNLSSLASVYSCVQRLEQVLLYSIQDESVNSESVADMLSSVKWQRRLSAIVPFIQVFEYDSIRRRISQGLNETTNTVNTAGPISDNEEKWNQGLLSSNPAIKESFSPEDLKTTAIVEMSIKFWTGLPKHWHDDTKFTWDKITFEVEQCLVKVDVSLHAHIGMLIAKDQDRFPNTADSMKHIVKNVVGNFFTGI
jgi:hypothetical protein